MKISNNMQSISFGNIIIKDGARKIINKRLPQRYQEKLDTLIQENINLDSDIIFDKYHRYSSKLCAYILKPGENTKPISCGTESYISSKYRNPLNFIQKVISESKTAYNVT